MGSIRASLVVGTTVATIAVIAVAGVVLHRAVDSTLVKQLDEGLEDKATFLASTVEAEPDSVELGFHDLDVREFERGEDAGYFQLWLDDGSVLYRSPSLEGNDLQKPAGGEEPVFYSSSLPNGRRTRVVSFEFLPRVDVEEDEDKNGEKDERDKDDAEDKADGEDEEGEESEEDDQHKNDEADIEEKPEAREDEIEVPMVGITLARGTESIDAFLAKLRNLLIAIGALTALVAGGVLALVIRKNLEPLDDLANKISGLDDSKLSSRVVLARSPHELAPVVNRLNELLHRLEVAFQREKTFSADVAHELRTPLAGLRSAMEVAMSRPRQAEDYKQTLAESLDIVRRVQNMVQTMLYLCRLDAGQIETEERPVAVDELIRASWKPLEDVAEARKINVDWRISPTATVMTDPILMEVAIRNILENAVTHADEGGYVRVEVNGQNKPVDIRVVNSGSIVEQDQVPELLQRFVRADKSRAAARSHSGLGLAIVKRISDLLRVSLDIRSRVGGEFEVTMSMNNVEQ